MRCAKFCGQFRWCNLNASQQAAFDQLKACDPQLSTSTNTLSEREKIKIYPNPASSVLTVFNPKNKTERYEIVDILGKTRFSSSLQSGENQLNIRGFENGVYYTIPETSYKRLFAQNIQQYDDRVWGELAVLNDFYVDVHNGLFEVWVKKSMCSMM